MTRGGTRPTILLVHDNQRKETDMHLILTGCEYVGTTTLGWAISQWAAGAMGGHHWFHDHWKIPHVNHPAGDNLAMVDRLYEEWAAGKGPDPTTIGLSPEERKQFLSLSPQLKEMFQRYHMDYHVRPSFYENMPDHNIIGMHVDEAVYGPLYHGYGGPGEYSDRARYLRYIEKHILELAPHTVNVLVEATPEVIRRRMRQSPHQDGLVQDKDIEYVVQRFEEEHERSLIKNKFTIDTNTATVEESLAGFLEKYEPFITDADKTRILAHKARQRGERP